MSTLVNINGRLFDEEDAKISIFDHGFLFGDSIYEVVRTLRGKAVFLDRHLKRLHRSAARIALELPYDDATITGEIMRTHSEAAHGDSYIRLIVTRGVGVLNIYPEDCDSPSMIIIVKPHEPPDEKYYRDGAKISVASIVRNLASATDPDIKSGNYLNNVLAIMEARKRGALEALMLNHTGELAECTTSNIILVRNGKIRTPPLSAGLLQGITREVLLELGPKSGFDIAEARLTPDDLYKADEVMLTSSLKEVMPVTRVDEHVVNDGKPGPVAKKLADFYRTCVEESLEGA